MTVLLIEGDRWARKLIESLKQFRSVKILEFLRQCSKNLKKGTLKLYLVAWLRLERSFDIRKHFIVILNSPNVPKSHCNPVEPWWYGWWPVLVIKRNVAVLVKSLKCEEKEFFRMKCKFWLTTGKGHDVKSCGAECLRSDTNAFAARLLVVPSKRLQNSNSVCITSR